LIPFVDLAAAHAELDQEIRAGFDRVMSTTAFINGSDVGAFEEEYAGFLGAAHCVGVANGTDALELALRAVGCGPGREVILPANTFVATAEAVVRAGARPVLVDVDPDQLLIDPAQVNPGPATAAIVPVHLYGQCAPVESFEDLGVPVVEDAAQSQGATRHGRAFSGGLAATSFYPGKNLGAYGDAGAVLTDDPAIAHTVRLLGDHGSQTKYRHETIGFNSRMDTLQAVVLRAKLRRLPAWNDLRRAAADRYAALLADLPGVVLPTVARPNEHVWHLYVIRVPDRDRVAATLRELGVATGIHYPVPIHLQPAFAHLGHALGDFPVTEKAAAEILSLPMFPHLTEEQQTHVANALRKAL
jgi:dTDP-4-amino-4,6-dideoxygalactose transaminase